MAERKRTLNLNVRVTEAERVMLVEVAERVGLSASDVLRQFIRLRHAELFGKPARPKPKRTKR
jgi:hypothetical protein